MRTIREVRTLVTRVITDVYYVDGTEVERKVTEETEEPIVECQECETEVSPSQTGGSSGDLGDISSFSSKASSSHHTSSGTSLSAIHSSGSSGRGAGPLKGKASGTEAADFALPSSRGGPGKLRCRQVLQREPSRGRAANVFISHEKKYWGMPHLELEKQCLFLIVGKEAP